MLKKKKIECGLCVVGGGMAGLCAAISAAREGIEVVLMHERPVLGGNASSEIRMWISHAKGRDNRETGILEEIYLESLYRNPTKSFAVWDTILYDFVRREKNITLLLNCTCMDADVSKGEYPDGRNVRINSVTGYQMTTQCFVEVRAKFFCDSSGDSILAPLTGAKFRIGREAKDEFGEDTALKEPDNMTMGMSCLLLVRAFKLSSDNTENFADVMVNDYYASELAIARNTGIVNGIGDNKFAPRSTITRQDMMVIVYRAMQKRGVGFGVYNEPRYPDFTTVALYARDAVSALISAGLVNGKSGLIAPTDYTTRAEVAVLVKRILDYIG